ncbi:MAG: hypothetical protein IPL47_06175 [Phyllobacteriaceae bacterium]|nr:hypothetical protein [Phyllobacteriaceae bacterium]
MAQTRDVAAAEFQFSEIGAQSASAITILVVLAVLIENALTPLFNWRVFRTYVSLKGWRTIIMVALSAAVVWVFGIDAVAVLVDKFNGEHPAPSPAFSGFLTTMVLAGGSHGVFNLLRALGVRVEPAAETQKPAQHQAWVAVNIDRHRAVGPVFVSITKLVPDATIEQIAGTAGVRLPKLRQLLFRNADRFPANGGHAVEAGETYAISVLGKDAEGKELREVIRDKVRFADRAIVDFTVAL